MTLTTHNNGSLLIIDTIPKLFEFFVELEKVCSYSQYSLGKDKICEFYNSRTDKRYGVFTYNEFENNYNNSFSIFKIPHFDNIKIILEI
jgi:hypothetical protein